ncbi:MAG: CPBP family intramembrane metalloprotease [Chloroflexi bacterium]|nr:CPBP family intramembrane metalloprotease [Chloroflexota bacterium]
MTTPVAIGLAALVVIIGLLITVWVFVPAFQGREAAARLVGSHRLELGAWLSVIVMNGLITIPLTLSGALKIEQGLTVGTFVIAALATDLPMLIFVYGRLIWPGVLTWTDLGLKPLPLEYTLRMGIAAGLGGLVVIDIVGTLLTQVGLRPNQLEEFDFVLNEGPVAFVVLLVAAAVVAPFFEELFFRGFLFGVYRRRQPVWLAYLVSSVLFTILHLEPNRMNLNQMAGLSVGIFMLALLLAWLYQHTGSLYPGMLAHAINNATGLILFYAFGVR